ncbi:hypothetical protein [Roseicella aquatilis]|uniref:Uncharacterized protein n=1 Tax=Roseicella aquatilis TaxID=2527868 RepID=A0A4R4DV39_9PROT|nr:hypothetical protein [Roseicella aquatilis]TCZ64984.1 hypothetical protein EXY23_06335 [Roseicella aquatilis]
MAPTLARVAGRDRLRLNPRHMASEDFAYVAEQAPDLFFWIGVTPPGAEMARGVEPFADLPGG